MMKSIFNGPGSIRRALGEVSTLLAGMFLVYVMMLFIYAVSP